MRSISPSRSVALFALFALLVAACAGRPVVGGDDAGDARADLGAVDMGAADTNPACAPTDTLCGARCVDTQTDRVNCGACGTTCPAGQVCVAGACATSCPMGQTVCGGQCVSTTTDRAHCGGCGTQCPAGQVCAMGRCGLECGPTLALCGGTDAGAGDPPFCADTRIDRRNCGACGNVCPAGRVCEAGRCVVACAAGQTECDGACRDLQSDPAHCGACGAACPAGQVCSMGTCQTTCGAGLTNCMGACRDTQTDRAHCGACGAACPAGQVCAAGRCEVSCPDGQTNCMGSCRDLQTDRAHCGACGAACPAGQVCSMGACALSCAAGQTNCMGACRDLQTDRAHCGMCGRACPAGQVCAAGACMLSCPAPQTACGGACVTLATDPAHCGMCGRACPSPANASGACVAGACRYACAAGFADCDASGANGCETNVAGTDTGNCGRCGGVCPAGANGTAACLGGACGFACAAGFGNCDMMLANGCEAALATDERNCGACGNACAAGQLCLAGRCAVPASCAQLRAQDPALPSGTYMIQPAGVAMPFAVQCDMTTHGGGWTLIGSFVNPGPRSWTSLAVLTDASSFGAAAMATTADFKSPAWSSVLAADLMVATSEYNFGFNALLGNRAFGPYIAANFPATCNTTWTRSGADFATNLSATQQRMLGFTLRAHDNNAACFPTSNENAAVVFHASECCWVNGIANTPAGEATWSSHDHSVLRLASLTPVGCTAGSYPCNANGLQHAQVNNCYDTSCKAPYALVWVR